MIVWSVTSLWWSDKTQGGVIMFAAVRLGLFPSPLLTSTSSISPL